MKHHAMKQDAAAMVVLLRHCMRVQLQGRRRCGNVLLRQSCEDGGASGSPVAPDWLWHGGVYVSDQIQVNVPSNSLTRSPQSDSSGNARDLIPAATLQGILHHSTIQLLLRLEQGRDLA